LNVGALAVSVAALGALAVLTGTPIIAPRVPVTPQPVASTPPPSPIVHRVDALTPKTLAELLTLPPDQLERVDIGLMNLLCAEGLPGSEGADIPALLGIIDKWAEFVALETARYYHQFVRDPADYENSEPYFRMLVLLTALQRDLGVHYNLAKVNDPDFGNAKDQFIHGMVNSDNGGTCVSMPVLYVAVGRRLGYPMKLVLAREHVFCRWDDGKGTVKNFEGAGLGLTSYPDEHYREWPHPISDEELKHREFLVSLTPAEELSVFLAARGHCLSDHRRFKEARECYVQAARLFPSAGAYPYFVHRTDLAMNPPIRVQPGASRNPWANFGMPDVPMPGRRGP